MRSISRMDCWAKIGAIPPPAALTARTCPGVASPSRSPRPTEARRPRVFGRSQGSASRSAAALCASAGPSRKVLLPYRLVSPRNPTRSRSSPGLPADDPGSTGRGRTRPRRSQPGTGGASPSLAWRQACSPSAALPIDAPLTLTTESRPATNIRQSGSDLHYLAVYDVDPGFPPCPLVNLPVLTSASTICRSLQYIARYPRLRPSHTTSDPLVGSLVRSLLNLS